MDNIMSAHQKFRECYDFASEQLLLDHVDSILYANKKVPGLLDDEDVAKATQEWETIRTFGGSKRISLGRRER